MWGTRNNLFSPPGLFRFIPTHVGNTRFHIAQAVECYRFIPTHVGNTKTPEECLNQAAVHPHACGEHGGCSMGYHRAGGSSPRMWGTQLTNPEGGESGRFIPTHVGNTA